MFLLKIAVNFSAAEVASRTAARALRIPENKLIVPDRLGRDIALPQPPIGSTLNPLVPTEEEAIARDPEALRAKLKADQSGGSGLSDDAIEAQVRELDVNAWIKTNPRRWRTWFLGQYPGKDAEFYAQALHKINGLENQLNGTILADTFEIPVWDRNLIDPFAIQADPSKAVDFLKQFTENGVERPIALSNHLAGELLVTDPEYIQYRQDVYANIIASPYLKKVIGDKDLSKKELDLDGVKALQKAAFEEMHATIDAAAASDIGTVNFFTGSNAWDLLYFFPNPNQVDPNYIEKKYEEAARRIMPLLEHAAEKNVQLALEVHPHEQSYSIQTTLAFINALLKVNEEATRRAFRVNIDASHLQKQNIKTEFLVQALQPNGQLGPAINRSLIVDESTRAAEESDIEVSWIAHHHHKNSRIDIATGIGSMLGDLKDFGDLRSAKDFTSGHLRESGSVNFEDYYGALARTGYIGQATLGDGHYRADSMEWEHAGLDPKSAAYLTLREMRRLEYEYNGGPGSFDAWKK